MSSLLPLRSLPPRALPTARLAAGVALSLTALAVVGSLADETLLLAPFAATAAVKHAAPSSRATSPLVVVAAYVVAALVGFACGQLLGSGLAAAVLATAAAAGLLTLGRVEHAPAVGMAFLVVHAPSVQAVGVAAVGAVVLVLTMQLVGPVLHGVRPALVAAER